MQINTIVSALSVTIKNNVDKIHALCVANHQNGSPFWFDRDYEIECIHGTWFGDSPEFNLEIACEVQSGGKMSIYKTHKNAKLLNPGSL